MALEHVKSWMTFMGWSNGGAPGAVKTEYGGSIVARYGDATWIKDVEDCCDRATAEAARNELARRAALLGHQQKSADASETKNGT